ncbi:hypothetical protein ACMD2_06668 [Ananas comosus]|uniref:BLOC-1-related complex subunit 6 C-terminal helix domain-containing protein n=1 Tax=Ananas comosus TaxID=4615 RepID=A0A199UG89_ANACO|nr:hypothetical protein ACMD2_06668 [Ananas comosus]
MEGDGEARTRMDAAAAKEDEPAPPPSDPVQENIHPGPAQNPVEPDPPPAMNRGEIVNALEVVERDSAAIAESFSSLFCSLRLALSEVTSTSIDNMECFSDVVGRLQESALDAASKGNKYINSCLRKILRKNVDSLDLAVNRLLRLP